MASLRLGWASRSLMRAHREKPLGRVAGTVSLRTVPLQEGARRKPSFTHLGGPESRLCAPGRRPGRVSGVPGGSGAEEEHGRAGKASARCPQHRREGTDPRVTTTFPFGRPPKNIYPAHPRRAAARGAGAAGTAAAGE